MSHCKDVTKLLMQNQDRELSLAEQRQIHAHVLQCPTCRAYQQNLIALQSSAASTNKSAASSPVPRAEFNAKPETVHDRPEHRQAKTADSASSKSDSAAIQVRVFLHDRLVKNIVVHGRRVEIGRDLANDIVIDDLLSSRRHAAVSLFRQHLYVEDLHSANGTLLNGMALTGRQKLIDNSSIKIGDFVLLCSLRIKNQTSREKSPFNDEATRAVDLADPTQKIQAEPKREVKQRSSFEATEPESPLYDDEESDRFREPAQSSDQSRDQPQLRPQFAPKYAPDIANNDAQRADFSPDRTSPRTALERPLRQNDYAIEQQVAHKKVAHKSLSQQATEKSLDLDAEPHQRERRLRPPTQAYSHTAPDQTADPSHILDVETGRLNSFSQNEFDHDNDDDPNDQPAPFSLLQTLLDEDFSGRQLKQSKRPILEIIHCHDDLICDLTSVQIKQSFFLEPPLVSSEAKKLGLPTRHRLVYLNNKAEIIVQLLPSFSGQVHSNGHTQDLSQFHPQQASPGLLRLGLDSYQAYDFIDLYIHNDRYIIRYAFPPDITESTRSADMNRRETKLERLGLIASMFSSVASHLVLMLLLFIVGLVGPQQQITELEPDRFVQVEVEDLALEKPPEPEIPPEPEPEPEAKPEPAQKPLPKPEKKASRSKRPRRNRKRNLKPAAAVSNPNAKVEKPGILAALGKIPKRSGAAGSQTLTAAVSNLDAVKVPGGGASYKVSGLIGKGPSKRLQLGGSGGGLHTKGLNSILREGGGGAGRLGKVSRAKVRGRVVKVSRGSRTQGQGILDRAQIQKVVNKGLGQIQFCYEKELLRNQSLSGKVIFQWTISTRGRVSQVKTVKSTMRSNAAITCMISKIKTWKFPKPRGDGTVIVTYPFVFNAMGF